MPISEAACYVGGTVRTLQRWDGLGILKAERTGTDRRLYTRARLAAFLGRRARAARRAVA